VLHGTTVATNMILEGKGAKAALVTTAGFRHVLTIGRQDIPRRANYLAWVKPARPVPASHTSRQLRHSSDETCPGCPSTFISRFCTSVHPWVTHTGSEQWSHACRVGR